MGGLLSVSWFYWRGCRRAGAIFVAEVGFGQIAADESAGLGPVGEGNGGLVGQVDDLAAPGAARAFAPEAQDKDVILKRAITIHTRRLARGCW